MSKKSIDLANIQYAIDRAAYELGLYVDGKEPKHKTLYSMLSKRFPIYTGSNIPAKVVSHLKEAHTCACADSKNVYIDAECVKEMLEKASEEREIDVRQEYLTADVADLVIHEYTHLLMEHLRQLVKFQKQSKNAKNVKTFSLACEIEANRGYDMRCWADIYAMGVTEAAFPEVRGVYGLHNIYKKLKEVYGNAIDEHMKEENDSDEQEEGEEQQEQGQEGNSSREEGKKGLSEKQKEVLNRLKEDFEEQEKQAEEMSKSMPSGSDEDAEEGEGVSVSGGGSASTSANQSPAELLRAYNRRHNQEIIKADLSTLKGILSGSNVSRGREKTYSRPARRDGDAGLMKKGVKKGNSKAPRVLIGMDSSGSMNSTTMQEVLNAISDIIKVTGREMKGSYICEHDCYVKHLSPLHQYREVIKGYHPDGGNSFNRLLKAGIDTNVECIINVGDGWDLLTEKSLMAEAKKRNLKWIDVIISSNVDKDELDSIIEREEGIFKEDYIGRTVLKLR